MWVLEKVLGIRQPVGAPAHRGTAVEEGITIGLMDPTASLKACVAAAETKYDIVSALSPDDRRDRYRATIAGMVETGLAELRPYGIPSATQELVTWHPAGLKHPIIGYLDFAWAQHGLVVDLKTSERTPTEIKIPHSRQVALYCSSGNMAGRVTYCTPKKCTTYLLENIAEHREALRQIALRVENFLALSDDTEFFKSIVAPDVESFYFGGPARQLAFEHFGI